MHSALYRLGAREELLLTILTHRLKTMLAAQAGRTFFAGTRSPTASALRWLKTLETTGLIEVIALVTHPEIMLEKPLARWRPCEPAPSSFAGVAWRLQQRWSGPPVRLPAVIATTKGARLFGGRGGRPPRIVEATHEVHLAQVWLKLPSVWQDSWTPDWVLARKRGSRDEPLPDAMVLGEDGQPIAIEQGGSGYTRRRLEHLFRYCEERSLGLDLW